MARPFHSSLLAAVVAVVVGGSALAQSSLQEAVNLLRVNKKDEAVAKLQEILSDDPSNEEAHELYTSVSQDEWFMLMTEAGEVQKIARSILERAKTVARERSRDEDAIQALVDTATDGDNDYDARRVAVAKLISDHGEFAVPTLLKLLGNADAPDAQLHAISVCSQLNTIAVLPLIEALKSSNDLAVQNVAAALNLIGDARALPMMKHLAGDARTNIATIAQKFVAKMGAGGDAVSMMLAQSRDYLKGNVPVGGFSDVVWTLRDDALVATDVPAVLYAAELAKSVAADAVRLAPASVEARSALAAANLAEAKLIEDSIAAGDDATADMGPVAVELKIAAVASGVDSMRMALESGVAEGLAPLAVGAIEAMAESEDIDDIKRSTLVEALASTDKRIKYAAAEALVRASRGADVPSLAGVVGALSEAVTEERVNTIHVIAPAGVNGEVAIANVARGNAFVSHASALDAMGALLSNPSTDVVVINEILPDRLPEDIIGILQKDGRFGHTKVVIITKDEDAVSDRFGDDVSYIQAPLTADNLQAAVASALDGVEDADGDTREGYASRASNALLNLALRKAAIGPAVANLAMQLNRGDSVAVPAAHAVGLAGGEAQLTALLSALENGSDDLKKAAAMAMGNILGGMASCPDSAALGLMAAMSAATDVELRGSIATALGKAKISSEQKLELLEKLGRIAGSEG
ncbi:MAG: HEAT repeat domain-containing protein [Planctomycetota bacterium]|nr:HEAT repeat domain-containing protein [Planctomycetota bacterium]